MIDQNHQIRQVFCGFDGKPGIPQSGGSHQTNGMIIISQNNRRSISPDFCHYTPPSSLSADGVKPPRSEMGKPMRKTVLPFWEVTSIVPP